MKAENVRVSWCWGGKEGEGDGDGEMVVVS